MQRWVAIWFRYFATDWFCLRQPQLRQQPLALRQSVHGRMVVTAVNARAEREGVAPGTTVADARAMIPSLQVFDDKPDQHTRALEKLALWCIRFTPTVAVDSPDGLLLDATGCAHLWGGELPYLQHVAAKLTQRGYQVQAAMADTPGAAWAIAHYANKDTVVPSGQTLEALLPLPPQALRLPDEVNARLRKLGIRAVKQLIHLPRQALRKRFGVVLLQQLDRALGHTPEPIQPVVAPEPFSERLPALDPVTTAEGIRHGLQQLLEKLCGRLMHEQKGLRKAVYSGHRVDGKITQISIATNRPSHHVQHLIRLFDLHLDQMEPGWGIELFVLEAPLVEPLTPQQEALWSAEGLWEEEKLAELVDRLSTRVGMEAIHRYLPAAHHWPERSFIKSHQLHQQPETNWRQELVRPLRLLATPERIEVSAPIPDYPPLVFRYRSEVHQVIKADGPERIEQEWWLQQGQHRDYYRVEDEHGRRYWLFRLGHYHEKKFEWFLHGFFA